MAKPDPAMSSSRRSGSVSWNSCRHSGLARDTRCPAAPVCQTLRNQIQSKPIPARPIELGVRDVVQRGGPPQRLRQRRQPDARVDLVERRDGAACPCQFTLDVSRVKAPSLTCALSFCARTVAPYRTAISARANVRILDLPAKRRAGGHDTASPRLDQVDPEPRT